MNTIIKEIATNTLKKVPFRVNNLDAWMDEYLIEYSKALVYECSDAVRESAKKYTDENQVILKAVAVDVLDHFGL